MHGTTALAGTTETSDEKLEKNIEVLNIGWCIHFAPSRLSETIRKLELRHGMMALAGEAHRDSTNDDEKIQKKTKVLSIGWHIHFAHSLPLETTGISSSTTDTLTKLK
jgi:hypothetical protein